MSDLDWKKLKKKTLGAIRQWVDISLYNHVAKETDLHTLWKNLENMYETKNAQENIFLMRKLVNLKLKEGQSCNGPHRRTRLDLKARPDPRRGPFFIQFLFLL